MQAIKLFPKIWMMAIALIVLSSSFSSIAQTVEQKVVVGSKRFTESYVLGELINQTLRDGGLRSEHRQGLGNTNIVSQALIQGQIDVYPEYTGTILREILKQSDAQISLVELNKLLAPKGIKAAIPLGFNNSYALALRADKAKSLGLKKISDITKLTPLQQSSLRIALSPEFKTRSDGWPSLIKGYDLNLKVSKVLEHGLAYDALSRGDVDIVDAYTTDAAVVRDNLVLLEDDAQVFPRYEAILLMRLNFDQSKLKDLENRLDQVKMSKLNQQAEVGVSFEKIARSFLDATADDQKPQSSLNRFFSLLFGADFFSALRDHILLVAISSLFALLVGIPLGVLAHRSPRSAIWILGTVGTLQTIPSLALLSILIALLGQIGSIPAVLALFLYGLLPIVNATHIGLLEVPANLKEGALALGCNAKQLLLSIELPSAKPIIMNGLASATVIGVGTCTLAALVGAGGFGERIVSGLATNDHSMMLAGAIPAAILALIAQAVLTPKRQ